MFLKTIYGPHKRAERYSPLQCILVVFHTFLGVTPMTHIRFENVPNVFFDVMVLVFGLQQLFSVGWLGSDMLDLRTQYVQ